MADKRMVLPELISGPRAGLAWVVKECDAMRSVVRLKASEQGIHVPERTLRQDWLVQQHELTHVADIAVMWPAPKDKHTRRFFKMLCEVAVEAISLANGVDIRQARDHLDWASFPLPDDDDMTAWAQLWLQFTFSADVAQHPAIKMMYQRACDTLGSDRVAWLCQARDAVVLAPKDRATRLLWADWLAKCFPRHVDTPKPPEQPKPKPPEQGEQGEGAESTENAGKEREEQGEQEGSEPNAAETPSQSEDSQEESEQDGDAGDDDAGQSDDASEAEPGEQAGTGDDSSGDEASESGDDDDDDDASEQGADGSEIETTEVDDDDWETPAEQVAERAGAGRLRAGTDAVRAAQEALEEQKRALDAAWDPDKEHGCWVVNGARIDIHRHTATRAARKIHGRGGVKASDSGTRLAFPRRLYQDGRVLARTGRVGGGILVDGSGSMAWNQRKVDTAVAILPGLWVGWYSLHQAAYSYAKTVLAITWARTAEDYARLRREAPYWARLCIIAERGKVADYKPSLETAYHTGGNEVDGDCLSYFARVCQGPKVWVSDGQVYGAPGHAQECARVMRQYNIVRVDTVDDAVRYLTGQPVMGYRDCSTRQHRLVK